MIHCEAVPDGLILRDDSSQLSLQERLDVQDRLLWPPLDPANTRHQFVSPRYGSTWKPCVLYFGLQFPFLTRYQYIRLHFQAAFCDDRYHMPSPDHDTKTHLAFQELLTLQNVPAICGPLLRSAIMEDNIPVVRLDHMPRVLRWMALNPPSGEVYSPLAHLGQRYPVLDCVGAVIAPQRHRVLPGEGSRVLREFQHAGYSLRLLHIDEWEATMMKRYSSLMAHLGLPKKEADRFASPFVVEVLSEEGYVMDSEPFRQMKEAQAYFDLIQGRLLLMEDGSPILGIIQ